MLRLARIAAIFCVVCISVVSLSESKIAPETAVGVWLFDEGTGNDRWYSRVYYGGVGVHLELT